MNVLRVLGGGSCGWCSRGLHAAPVASEEACGRLPLLERLSKEPERIDRYMTEKLGAGLSPKTVVNHVRLLSKMLKTARAWKLIRDNPIAYVELPKVRESEMSVLTEAEIARLLTAYRQLEADAKPGDQAWWRLARRLITVALGTGCRRGEVLGFTWGDIALTERRLQVRQAFVRGEMTAPKSGKGRWLDLGPKTAEALEEQFAATISAPLSSRRRS